MALPAPPYCSSAGVRAPLALSSVLLLFSPPVFNNFPFPFSAAGLRVQLAPAGPPLYVPAGYASSKHAVLALTRRARHDDRQWQAIRPGAIRGGVAGLWHAPRLCRGCRSPSHSTMPVLSRVAAPLAHTSHLLLPARLAACELAPHGIRVNAVAPGPPTRLPHPRVARLARQEA